MKLKGNIVRLSLLCLTLMVPASALAGDPLRLYLVWTGGSWPVDTNQVYTLELWMDFSSDPTLGGGFAVEWDPTRNTLTNWVWEDIGDPSFRLGPDGTFGSGRVEAFIGDFLGIPGPEPVATLTFQAGTTPGEYPISLGEGNPKHGPFFSAITFMQQIVDYQGFLVEIVSSDFEFLSGFETN